MLEGGRAMRTLLLSALLLRIGDKGNVQPGCSTLFRAQRKPVMNREKMKLPWVLARTLM